MIDLAHLELSKRATQAPLSCGCCFCSRECRPAGITVGSSHSRCHRTWDSSLWRENGCQNDYGIKGDQSDPLGRNASRQRASSLHR